MVFVFKHSLARGDNSSVYDISHSRLVTAAIQIDQNGSECESIRTGSERAKARARARDVYQGKHANEHVK